eukprot:ANDGO_01086.mRNA.1 FAM206 family protein
MAATRVLQTPRLLRSGEYDVKFDVDRDRYFAMHSNHVCITGIAEGHPCLTSGKRIEKVEIPENRAIPTSVNRSKRNSSYCEVTMILCILHMEDGTKYKMYAGMKGLLLEINEKIVENPQLIQMDPYGAGFLAIAKAGAAVKQKWDSVVTYAEYKRRKTPVLSDPTRLVPTQNQESHGSIAECTALKSNNRKRDAPEPTPVEHPVPDLSAINQTDVALGVQIARAETPSGYV